MQKMCLLVKKEAISMFDNEKTYKAYIEGMDQYIQELVARKKNDPKRAKEKAENSLRRSGILNSKGDIKSRICE